MGPVGIVWIDWQVLQDAVGLGRGGFLVLLECVSSRGMLGGFHDIRRWRWIAIVGIRLQVVNIGFYVGSLEPSWLGFNGVGLIRLEVR